MNEKTAWEIENEIGFDLIAGVDEAGRGPLAGPVCVAAVILPHGVYINGIDDSKKLSDKRKDLLFDEITEKAVAYNIVLIPPDDIDRLNILNATFKGMCDSVNGLSVHPEYVLIDGNAVKGMKYPHKCVIKGDSKSISIAAASILAKVTRDRYMAQMDKIYPQYQFAKHKGYPTKLHYELLEQYGSCGIHRKSFRLTS